jgi:hypothetical protein
MQLNPSLQILNQRTLIKVRYIEHTRAVGVLEEKKKNYMRAVSAKIKATRTTIQA